MALYNTISIFRLRLYWKPLEKYQENGDSFAYILVQLNKNSHSEIYGENLVENSKYNDSNDLPNNLIVRNIKITCFNYSLRQIWNKNIDKYINACLIHTFQDSMISKQLMSKFGSSYAFKIKQLEQTAECDLSIDVNQVSNVLWLQTSNSFLWRWLYHNSKVF